MGTPYCFYPSNWGYQLTNPQQTSTGITATLTRVGPPSPYGGDVNTLKLDIMYETTQRLHFKISDPNNARYEVPIPTPKVSTAATNTDYQVSYTLNPFGIAVQRASTKTTIFNTTIGGMIFSDQFLQITTFLPSTTLMGLGEHVSPLLLDTNWQEMTLWARDQGTPTGQGYNLYGVHPFYVSLEQDGNAHGVFFLNSNAMDIILQPTPALTYRSIGGIMDFYVFLGPTVDSVVNQYENVVGRPYFPPYWALGFHLCRWGYNSVQETQKINDGMRNAGVPQDVQWNDIDYMRSYLDFTFDPNAYGTLPQFVNYLHSNGQRYVVITDPGISNTQPAGSYQPYTDGISMNIFVKDSQGQNWQGQVWPGWTNFPDFSNPQAESYWEKQISAFHSQVGFDGLWIDMNEIATTGSSELCPVDKYTQPPYEPNVAGNLSDKNMCTDNVFYGNQLEYNIHSLYGYNEMVATKTALENTLKQRTLVISRSTYSGAGVWGGHWLGDNSATWNDIYYSIPGILSFQLFGIPLVGADICGFNGDTTEELCARWMQLGSFYPFSRNHNTIGDTDQDPVSMGSTVTAVSIDALSTRYWLLPFMYTLFHHVSNIGDAATIARALLWEFPTDQNTYPIDQQFLWGSALLISPVLTQGATTVKAYFPPAAIWYDLKTGARQQSTGWQTLSAPLQVIPLHVRGGYILPTQQPNITTTYSRTQPFGLLVTLDSNNSSIGDLYVDDGVTLNAYQQGAYSYLQFNFTTNMLQAKVMKGGYTPPSSAPMNTVTFYGVQTQPSAVTLNGKALSTYNYNSQTQVLNVTSLSLPMISDWSLSWQ